MQKEIWKPGTVLYPVPAAMVTVGDIDGEKNIITVAWTGTINSDPAMTYISVRPERYSYEMLKNNREFVINLTTKDLVKACDFCGVKSGRDIDKFEACALTAQKATKVRAPILAESPVNIECQVMDILPLGSHHMFLAKVVAVDVTSDYLDENGKFHFNDTIPICYSHGEYYAIGEKLGKFGSFIRKKH